MSAMTDLKVKDDAATPTEYTFVPVTDTPNPIWRTRQAGVPIDGQMRVTGSVEKLKSGTYKITAKLEVPVMETLGASGSSAGYVAPPKVAYVLPIIVTTFADPRSTDQDRANALRVMVGLLQGASSTSGTGTLNNASAGGAFGASVAPLTQMFTGLVVPN